MIKHIVRENGLRGLFSGFGATLAREMPGYFFFFGGYEVSRTLLTPHGQTKDDLSKYRYSRNCLEDHPICHKNIWSLKPGGLWLQGQLY